MKRIENIKIDVKNKQYDEIKLKQMDTTQLVFNLYDNSQEIVLVDLTADVVFTKPNGTIVIQNAVVDATKQTVTVDLMADCVRDYGKGQIEVELKAGNEVLSSFQMDVKIEKTSKENIHSDNTPNYIESMELAVSELRAQGEEILEEYENLVAEVQTVLANITNRGHIYGIKRKITDLNGNVNNTSTTWTKIYDNAGLVAEAQKGSNSNVRNDYENLYPWNSIITLNYDRTNKKVNAYYGDADFKFDGSNGEVLTRYPKMWIKRLFPIQEEDGFYEYRLIADFELQDFIQIDEFELGRYKIFVDSNNVAHSQSGKVPKYNANIVNFSTYAANSGDEFCLEDWRRFVVETVYLVEYADNNIQAKLGNGIQSYSKATALKAESSTNRIIVSSVGTGLYIGKTICIGTSAEWNSAVAANREITAVETYSDGSISGYAITFDGDPVNIAVGNIIWGSAQKTGGCDALGMKSGCLINDGYHSVIYRGLEDIFAHLFEFIVGINIKDYLSHINYNPSTYAPNVFDGDYEALSYSNPNNQEGYIKVMGFDKKHPLIALPTVLGASSTTGYADYCYSKNAGNRVALVGGNFNYGAYAGLFCWYFNYDSSGSYWSFGARLLKYQ